MSLKRGTKVEHGYATVSEDDGVNYREIAETMTDIGFKMNHSSARNYVLRVMRKFVSAMSEQWDIDLTEERIDQIAKSPDFQQGVAEILQTIEADRRARNRSTHRSLLPYSYRANMSIIKVKNLPRLKLSDLLRRRKMTLKSFLDEFGITTYEGLKNRCDRMGVAPPEQLEFEKIFGSSAPAITINNPTEGILVVEPETAPDVVVITGAEVEEPELASEPSSGSFEWTQKKSKKKKDVSLRSIIHENK